MKHSSDESSKAILDTNALMVPEQVVIVPNFLSIARMGRAAV